MAHYGFPPNDPRPATAPPLRYEPRVHTVRVVTQHPRFGLYVDPHEGRHSWWAVDSRAAIGLVATLASLGAVLSVAVSRMGT